jgi:hypothetical protein
MAVALTYAIARRVSGQRWLAGAAAALHAVMPQVLFIGSVLNDDNLLLFLSGLLFLILSRTTRPPQPGRLLLLGALLGLATVAKYNALPLWGVVLAWLIWLKAKQPALSPPDLQPPASSRYPPSAIRHLLPAICYLLLGAFLTAGWWFVFIWRNFNQVDQLGWLSGSLAALSAGTSDASLRRLAAGRPPTLPPLAAWPDWFVNLFETFWGSFGGGHTIDLPAWAYGLIALFCLCAVIPLIRLFVIPARSHATEIKSITNYQLPPYQLPLPLFLLSPLFFLPLPLFRFLLSGSLVETAQGRHLFPALPAITLGLVWGLSEVKFLRLDTLRLLPVLLVGLTFGLSLFSLNLIQASYPPLIPLRTEPNAATVAHVLNLKPVASLTLVGYELGTAGACHLPLTLVWRANAIPPQDYLIELNVATAAGQTTGTWLGHPLGGRYPTRAWDKGDILRHTVPIPLLPGFSAAPVTITLRLRDAANQPAGPPIRLVSGVALAPAPVRRCSPSDVRADELPAAAPFSYRSTLSFSLPGRQAPTLLAPTGQSFAPASFSTGEQGSIAHFIVAANWPSGEYRLKPSLQPFTVNVVNRPRQFEPPPMSQTLNANFADTLTLLGYDLPQRRVQPGAAFPLTLHWRAEQTMGQNLIVFNHLLNQANRQYGGADRVPQLYYTTLLWVPQEIVSDAYRVPVDGAAPAGIYWLDVGLYPSHEPTFSLPLVANGQLTGGNSVRLGPLKVGGPPPGVTVATAQPQHPLSLSFGSQITLLGYSLNNTQGQALDNSLPATPDSLLLTLFWRADSLPQADYTVFVHLLDASGHLVTQFDGPPAAGAYPSSLWDPGEIVVDEHELSNVPAGRFTVAIGLYDPGSGARLPLAGAAQRALKLVEVEIK